MFKTDRLTIRPFTLQDKAFLFKLNNDKEVNRYRPSSRVSMAYCVDSIKDWHEKYGEGLLNVYLMEISETKDPIGLIALFKRDKESKAELGYRMMSEYWRKGYCREASTTLIKKYFSVTQEEEIFAETHPENINSIDFLTKNKFVKECHDMKDRGSIYITFNKCWTDK